MRQRNLGRANRSKDYRKANERDSWRPTGTVGMGVGKGLIGPHRL